MVLVFLFSLSILLEASTIEDSYCLGLGLSLSIAIAIVDVDFDRQRRRSASIAGGFNTPQ
jgi:hypothetical protein